jgi:hypothetical protein
VAGVRNRYAVSTGTRGRIALRVREETGYEFRYDGQHADRQSRCCVNRLPKQASSEGICGRQPRWWQYPCPGADSNRRLPSLPLVASQAFVVRNTGIEPATIRVSVVGSTVELISWRFLRGSIRYTRCNLPALACQSGIQRTRTAECVPQEIGHPGRNQTADARLVRAALWSLSYRAVVW